MITFTIATLFSTQYNLTSFSHWCACERVTTAFSNLDPDDDHPANLGTPNRIATYYPGLCYTTVTSLPEYFLS